MGPQHLLRDVKGLVAAVVEKLSRHKVADRLGHDKATVVRWLEGAIPAKPADVAALIQLALAESVDIAPFQTFEPIYDLSEFLSYEQKARSSGPDLSWLTSSRMPPPVRRTVCGIPVTCPLGVASSPLVATAASTTQMLSLGFGLTTFKTRRAGVKQSWAVPQMAYLVEPPELRDYDLSNPPDVIVGFNRPTSAPIPDLVNSIGVPSEKWPVWQAILDDILRHEYGRYVGASVMAEGSSSSELLDDFDLAISKAIEVKPAFVELNISCPNLEKRGGLLSDLSILSAICDRARARSTTAAIPLFVKIPCLRGDHLRQFVKAVLRGADAICLRNSVRVRPFMRNRDGELVSAFPGREFGGLSGPSTYQLTRQAVADLVDIKRTMKA